MLKFRQKVYLVLMVKCVLEDEDWKVVEDDIFEIFDEIIRFYS